MPSAPREAAANTERRLLLHVTSTLVGPATRHALGVEPKEDESILGFMFRLAKRRGTPHVKILAKHVGIAPLSGWSSEESLIRLAATSGAELSMLRRMSYGPGGREQATFHGRPIGSVLINGRATLRQACPACLGESSHHRAVWDVPMLAVCPVHGTMLLTACVTCRKKLQWTNPELERCRHCRADLTRAVEPSVRGGGVAATAAAYGLLGDGRFAEEAAEVMDLLPLRDLEPAQAFEFLVRVGWDLANANSMPQPRFCPPTREPLLLGDWNVRVLLLGL